MNKEVIGKIEIKRNGHAYLVCEDCDYFVNKKNLGLAINGDTIKVELIPENSGDGLQGVFKEIIKRNQGELYGRIDIMKNKGCAFVRTSEMKGIDFDFYVPIELIGDAVHNDVVTVSLEKWSDRDKSPLGKVTKVFGADGQHDTEMSKIIHKNNIDYSFSEEVIKESESISIEISDKEISRRKDMRDVLTLTIDPDSAKDFDDAISFKKLDNGNYEIGVHIADVSHYVKPGSELDKEAFLRATSVYLVDRCIPMLPERLSNGICSLRPNEDKLVFSVLFEVSPIGDIVKEKFKKCVINSNFRYTYEEAQAIIDNIDTTRLGLHDDLKFQADESILTLDSIAKSIRKRRFKEGAVTFNRSEPQFILDENNKAIDVFFHESSDSHELIEEFMLMANKAVATYAHNLTKPYIYRTHDLPNQERLQELSELVSKFGYKFNTGGSTQSTKESLNLLLSEVKDTPEQEMVESLAVRTMSKAKYSPQVIGHYGLGFKHYSHFTSPIRRYPDLISHRLLNSYLNHRNGDVSKLTDQCDHCSDMEVKAARAQRESIKYKQCEYLSSRVGEEFVAIIGSIKDFGVFAKIKENGCDGLLSKKYLDKLHIHIDEENHCMNNFGDKGGGETYRLGDEITVVVSSVDVSMKQINFKIVL